MNSQTKNEKCNQTKTKMDLIYSFFFFFFFYFLDLIAKFLWVIFLYYCLNLNHALG